MAAPSGIQPSSSTFIERQYTNEHQLILLNTDEQRSKNREQLIEKLERVIQEKNASIIKLEEREQYLEDALKKRNAEFRALEEQLRQFEEKTGTFEQLHQLQVQTFEKTIRDCQIENERLCENVQDLTKQLKEKSNFEVINQEKILSFDRIAADTQLWRQKLDSYKETIEQQETTILTLKKEINELQKKKQTNADLETNSLRLQISNLENIVHERDHEIEHFKLTLRDRDHEINRLRLTLHQVRDKLATGQLSNDNRWKSCSEGLGRNSSCDRLHRSSSLKRRPESPAQCDEALSSGLDVEYLKNRVRTLTDRLEQTQRLLVKRDDQIATLKKVHDKRWLRLKHLQKQYSLVKDELQSYTDDECHKKTNDDYSYAKYIRRNKMGCTVCNCQRRKKAVGANRRIIKHEDDDNVFNEVTKLRHENERLTNENLSLSEKNDLQEVEINEQAAVIDELRNEIQLLNDKDHQSPLKASPLPIIKSNEDQQRKRTELDKKLYELENERTCLVFEIERYKTNLDLCTAEKQTLMQQRTQATNEIKQLKLRILSLQDQIYKLKRSTPPIPKRAVVNPNSTIRKRMIKKKPRRSCLEVLLDQNQSSALFDDVFNESTMLDRTSPRSSGFGFNQRRQRHRPCSLCDYHTQSSFMKRRRLPSASSTVSKRKHGPLKKMYSNRVRLSNSLFQDTFSYRNKKASPAQKAPPRTGPLRKRIEQLEMSLADANEENEQLKQRLSMTLSRINVLKTTNHRLIAECDRLKNDPLIELPSPERDTRRHDSINSDGLETVDNLYNRLKNASFDAARQRKLNKTLQTDNETLTKNLQSLTEKLTHTERDVASKRSLIENYKSRLSELESTLNRSNDKTTNENDEERLKSLTETMDKLRVALDSHKNRLQAVTREKQLLETRYGQLMDEHQKLKTRLEDIQTKYRLSEQHARHHRANEEQLNEELLTARRSAEQQLSGLNTKNQDTLNKLNFELNRCQRRLNEYERFTHGLLHEVIRRNIQMNESLKRAREHQKQRESFSTTLPGYDNAIHTASKILNLTQDDLDEIMSTTDESFQAQPKNENVDKNEKLRYKVSKILVAEEEFASKLLKIFSKKLDELQATDRNLATLKNS